MNSKTFDWQLIFLKIDDIFGGKINLKCLKMFDCKYHLDVGYAGIDKRKKCKLCDCFDQLDKNLYLNEKNNNKYKDKL